MTAPEWTPGDIAKVDGDLAMLHRTTDDSETIWITAHHALPPYTGEDRVRPVAVIDPDDADQLERFCIAAWGSPTKWSYETEDTRRRFRAAIRDALRLEASS